MVNQRFVIADAADVELRASAESTEAAIRTAGQAYNIE